MTPIDRQKKPLRQNFLAIQARSLDGYRSSNEPALDISDLFTVSVLSLQLLSTGAEIFGAFTGSVVVCSTLTRPHFRLDSPT